MDVWQAVYIVPKSLRVRSGCRGRPACDWLLAVHHRGVPDGLPIHRPPNRHEEERERV